MISIKELQQKLKTEIFFKKAIPNVLFFFKPWKKSYKQYQESQNKGIAKNVLIRDAEHEEINYRVYAYSVNGEMSVDVIINIKNIVANIPIGTIRFEANGTNGIFPLINENGEMCFDADDIKGLCRQFKDVYLHVLADGDVENLDCPYTVYLQNGNAHSHWAVARKFLS